jgi:hypothetical protein
MLRIARHALDQCLCDRHPADQDGSGVPRSAPIDVASDRHDVEEDVLEVAGDRGIFLDRA